MATKKELEKELERLRAAMTEADEEIDRIKRAAEAATTRRFDLQRQATATKLELDRLKPMGKRASEMLLSCLGGPAEIDYRHTRGPTQEGITADDLERLGFAHVEIIGKWWGYRASVTLTDLGRAKAEEIKAKQK